MDGGRTRGRDDVIDRSVVVSGTAHPDLAHAMAAAGRFEIVAADIERFPDGELHVAVDEGVAGAHVHLVQPTGAPADRHLLELLLLVDACRRAGARAEVPADQIVGAVAGRTPVIVDDMISTGATIAAAAAVLARAGARERMVIAATHGVFSGAVVDALDRLPVDRLLVTDTLPDVRRRLPAADVISVAGLLAVALHEPGRFAPGADLPPGIASGLLRHLR